jgi:hypothetical protein
MEMDHIRNRRYDHSRNLNLFFLPLFLLFLLLLFLQEKEELLQEAWLPGTQLSPHAWRMIRAVPVVRQVMIGRMVPVLVRRPTLDLDLTHK